jgi:hypothetical protein
MFKLKMCGSLLQFYMRAQGPKLWDGSLSTEAWYAD